MNAVDARKKLMKPLEEIIKRMEELWISDEEITKNLSLILQKHLDKIGENNHLSQIEETMKELFETLGLEYPTDRKEHCHALSKVFMIISHYQIPVRHSDFKKFIEEKGFNKQSQEISE